MSLVSGACPYVGYRLYPYYGLSPEGPLIHGVNENVNGPLCNRNEEWDVPREKS